MVISLSTSHQQTRAIRSRCLGVAVRPVFTGVLVSGIACVSDHVAPKPVLFTVPPSGTAWFDR